MIAKFYKNHVWNLCTTKSNWLIVALTLSVFAVSCTAPRSVRNSSSNGRNISKSYEDNLSGNEKKALTSSEEDSYNKEIKSDLALQAENETFLTPASETENKDAAPPKRKILSLREQMRVYEGEQKNLATKMNEMDDDIQSIKRTLDKIKITMTEKNFNQKEAIAGETETEESVEPPQPKTAKSKKIILSDENESSIKKPTAKPLQAKANTKKAKAPMIIKPDAKPQKTVAPEKKNIAKAAVKSTKKEKVSAPVKPIENESIEQALKSFVGKDYQKSVNDFSTILASAKDAEVVAKSNYWIGESFFAMKQWDKAIASFQKVLRTKNAPMHDNAQMMIAESLIRSGQIPEAKRAFKVFVDSYPQSEYIPRARKMLQQL